MKKENVIMIEELMEYAKRNDYFNLTVKEFNELDKDVSYALEKQVSMDAKPMDSVGLNVPEYDYKCPYCFTTLKRNTPFCPYCGQSINYKQ